MTVALSTLSSALMASMTCRDPAPPTITNSSRLASSIAAITPTPWSSSWFHSASMCGAACNRFAAAASPTRCPTAVLRQRQGVDTGDLGHDGIGVVADLLADVPVSYTHLRAHETRHDLVCRL